MANYFAVINLKEYLNNKLQFFHKFWAIAKLYWFSNEKWGAIFSILLLLGLLQFSTQMNVIANTEEGNFISALAAKDPQRFWRSIGIFVGLRIFLVVLRVWYTYVRFKPILAWRLWLTNYFIGKYLNQRSFYEINNFQKELDNPDQRIAEDIQGFTEISISIFLDLFNTCIQVIAFSGVLWRISPTLMIFLIIYAGTGTLISIGFFGKKLVNINVERQKKEGDFRFGLVRLRENAESVAFYRGEAQEINLLQYLFKQVFNNFISWIIWQQVYFGAFIRVYDIIPPILPALVLAPKVLAGELEVGKIAEAAGAFMALNGALYVIVRRFENLTNLGAGIERLFEFYNFLQQPKRNIQNGLTQYQTINTIEDKCLAIQNLTLYTPNYQRILFHDISFTLQPGQGLLIQGTSGCGKSSLLRAIAGLWDYGTGTIIRPKLEEMLFLPQRPYMVLGNLRNQLIYPQLTVNITDDELEKVLQQVNLPNLVNRFGSFNVEKDWSDVLSLGEQQRIAFARLIITKPKYVILDEATSALDIENERNLYQYLLDTQTTFISVGHRPTIFKYHQITLELMN
ncbi:ABC transporter ATP-binding protein/permease [Tolypothrix sp. PCC 7910]|uniref:ABC transporter ATP-binding protein/permease n=1 Tax=Tolypothrix sp. PCC 7910 TaxID=2099387 RepID=UPI00142799D2|nr:ABC transporter ATP-binding protein/permease [Tolypothrix sp. PCC 7910]QIR38613.1 ABC transporter ATP-binding protein/permease [Tolypothrix sp. PCC 7910]